MIPDYPLDSSCDDCSVRMGRGLRAGVRQALGQGVELEAAVEAEHELVDVVGQVLGADAVMGAEQPCVAAGWILPRSAERNFLGSA